MRLAALQSTFWSMATRRHELDHAAEQFVGTHGLSATARIGIYADMFLWRQVDCLREDFPKLAAVHGDFFELARAYLDRHPSQHASLALLGKHMSGFLAATSAGLADLAALEWARAEIFEEADAPILAQPDLTQPLYFVPALRVLSLTHDVCPLWQALEDGREAAPLARADNRVVVWRKDYEVFHVRLADAEARALERAMQGDTLEQICAEFADEPEPVAAALQAIGSWFAEGWIEDRGGRS